MTESQHQALLAAGTNWVETEMTRIEAITDNKPFSSPSEYMAANEVAWCMEIDTSIKFNQLSREIKEAMKNGQ